MNENEPGLPPVAFAQLLKSPALDREAVARFRAIMEREEVDEAFLVGLDRQVPVRWFREVFPRLEFSQAVALGVACAEQAQLTSFGPLSLPLISAGSVAEIVELLAYLPVISTALSPQFQPGEASLVIGLAGRTGYPDLDCLVVTYCGVALLRLMDLLVVDASDARFYSTGPDPGNLAPHEDVLWDRLVFGAPASFVEVRNATLDEVCRFSDPVAYRLAITELEQKFSTEIEAKSVAAKVRRLLDDGAGAGSLDAIAAELSMSKSTLKRRLANEGTTYRDLLESSRLERATMQLLDQSRNIGEIATSLGYSDLTSFSHAFKRWTGQSPRHFRRRVASHVPDLLMQ